MRQKRAVLYINGCDAGTKKELKRIGKVHHRSMQGQALAFIEAGIQVFIAAELAGQNEKCEGGKA